MKLLCRVLFLLVTLFVLSSGAVMAQAPIPPLLFRGELIIDDVKAPVGTIVVAEVEGKEVSSCTVDGMVIEEGQYMITVPNNGNVGKMVEFKVDGIVAGEHEYTSSMENPIIELDLDVKTGSSGTSGKTGDSPSGLFGLSTVAIAGIAVGIVAAAVVAVLLVRRRRWR